MSGGFINENNFKKFMTEPIGLLLHVENFSKTQEEALDTGQAGGQDLYTTSDIEDLKMETSYDSNMANPNPFQELRISKDEGLSFIKANFGKISQRQIAREIGLGSTTVNRWSREIGLVFKKHTVNETFFDKLNENSAYILGLIYSDGNIAWNTKKGYYSLTITASEKDVAHLENIRNLLTSTKPLLYAPKTKSYRLIVNNKNLCLRLMQLGVTPRKSLTIKFPEIPQGHLKHFMRGVIDGDGNVRYVSRKRSPYFEITIASGSIDFCKGLVNAVKQSIGVNANIRKVGKNVYTVQYSCSRGEKLAEYIYHNATIFLARKYLEYKKRLEASKNG